MHRQKYLPYIFIYMLFSVFFASSPRKTHRRQKRGRGFQRCGCHRKRTAFFKNKKVKFFPPPKNAASLAASRMTAEGAEADRRCVEREAEPPPSPRACAGMRASAVILVQLSLCASARARAGKIWLTHIFRACARKGLIFLFKCAIINTIGSYILFYPVFLYTHFHTCTFPPRFPAATLREGGGITYARARVREILHLREGLC